MLGRYFFYNPEIIRYIRINFRYPRVLSIIILYLLAIFSIYSLFYFVISLGPSKFDWKAYSKILYVSTMMIEYVMYFYFGTYLIANSLSIEKEKGTFDFIRMTTINRRVIAIGKLIGAPVFLSFLILISLPLFPFFMYLGQIDIRHFLIANLNLVIYGFLFHTIGLFCAVTLKRSSAANGLSLIIPAFITILSFSFESGTSNPYYFLFSALEPDKSYNYFIRTDFYGFAVPEFAIILLIYVYIIVCLIAGLVRKLDSESNHVFSRKQALLILITNEILLFGLLWNDFVSAGKNVLPVYFTINMIFLLLLTAIISPSREDIYSFLNKARRKSGILREEKSPVFLLIFIFCLIADSFAILGTSLSVINTGINELLIFSVLMAALFVLFNLIYSQIYFLANILFIKNSSTLSLAIIVLSMAFPLPLNFFTKNNSDLSDLFILNPFVAFSTIDERQYYSLETISQFIILFIILLLLNVIIISKKEDIYRKYKL